MLQAFGTFFCLQIIDDSAVIKIAEMDDKINRKNGERETRIVCFYRLPALPMLLELMVYQMAMISYDVLPTDHFFFMGFSQVISDFPRFSKGMRCFSG
jgi:hypothetical protein